MPADGALDAPSATDVDAAPMASEPHDQADQGTTAPAEPEAPAEPMPEAVTSNGARAEAQAAESDLDDSLALPTVSDPGVDPQWSVVHVSRITMEFPAAHALVILGEDVEPGREVAIPIGLPEATALGHAWRRVPTPRPLTHELFADVLTRLGATIEVVRLVGRVAGVVSAEMEISSPRGPERVPCRPTDGLTMALRQGVRAPVLVDDRLFDPEADVEPADNR